MAAENDPAEYMCPECTATVEPDWAACPSCGVEFEAPEEGEPLAGVTEAREEPGSDELGLELEDLEREIEAASGPPARAAAPPTRGRATPPAPFVARLGGTVGSLGVLLVGGGAMGALVALNWDTWVSGAAVNSIGGLQQMAVGGMIAACAAGGLLVLFAQRRPQRA